MPTVSSSNTSPSCKFKILFCKRCDQSLNDSTEVKCDGCKGIYHDNCIITNQNQVDNELIRLCQACSDENRMYTPTRKQKQKANEKSIVDVKSMCSKNLRSRAVSIDSASVLKVKSKRGQQSNAQSKAQSTLSDTIIARVKEKMRMFGAQIDAQIDARIAQSEKSPCKCSVEVNNKIAAVEES